MSGNLIVLGTLVGTKKAVQFDVPTLLETGLVIQAQSGGGKSHAIRRILEKTHPLVQQAVLDLEGEFPTLRESYDYIIAGKGGDIGLTVGQKMPQLLAIKLLELRASAIMDLYELKSHDRIRFVRLFLEAVMDAPKALYHSVLFVLDESHHFAPQVGEAESYAAVIDLCARGRKRGFRPILATQRISKLHKDACAELGNKMIGRTGLDIDQKRAADELDMGKSDRLNLRNLKPGEFHVYGPALRVDGNAESGVVLCKVGSVRSRHPQAGARQLEAPPEASSAVKRIVSSLANLPAEAEAKAKTEEDLRKENADLKRKLTLAEKGQAVPAGTKERMAQLQNECNEWKELCRVESNRVKTLKQVDQKHQGLLQKMRSFVEQFESVASETVIEADNFDKKRPTMPQPVPARKEVSRSLVVPNVASDGLSRAQQKILDALAELEQLGRDSCDKSMLAALCGASPRSGGYFNNLGRLRTLMLVTYPVAGAVALTAQGRSLANPSDGFVSLEEYHERWFAIVKKPQAEILRVLIEHRRPMKKDDLAESVGVSSTSGGYFNNLGRLRTLGAVEYPAPGLVEASDLMFPDGLA